MLDIKSLGRRDQDFAALACRGYSFGRHMRPIGDVLVDIMQDKQMGESMRYPSVEMVSIRLVVPPPRDFALLASFLVLEPARPSLDLNPDDQTAVEAAGVARLD